MNIRVDYLVAPRPIPVVDNLQACKFLRAFTVNGTAEAEWEGRYCTAGTAAKWKFVCGASQPRLIRVRLNGTVILDRAA